MKKFLCLMLAMVMALTVVACGKKPQDNSDPKGSDLKIGLISGLTGFGDLSMNDQAKTGCDMCVKEYGVTYKAVEPKDTTQVLDMIQSFAGEGYQIIIPTTWNLAPKNANGESGPMEQALIGNPVGDIEKPINALRTVHSFDPCTACAVHITEPATGKSFETVTSPWGVK